MNANAMTLDEFTVIRNMHKEWIPFTIGPFVVRELTSSERYLKLLYPYTRILTPGDPGPYCADCGSSLRTRLKFFKTSKCIQPTCPNYYAN